MAVTFSKVLALLIAGGYVAAAIALAPQVSIALMVALMVMVPLGLIWFPDLLGGSGTHRKKTVLYTYDEPSRLRRPWRDSHPVIVSFMGWFFLVGLPPLVYWISKW